MGIISLTYTMRKLRLQRCNCLPNEVKALRVWNLGNLIPESKLTHYTLMLKNIWIINLANFFLKLPNRIPTRQFHLSSCKYLGKKTLTGT